MTADVQVKQPSAPLNPCCTLWKDKCSKLEAGRKHLRQAVQILNEQVDKFQAENLALKKACEEEQARAGTEKEKELAARVAFENEIVSLKSEICSLKHKGSADAEDKKGEVKLLQDHLSKAEKEIARLKALLENEKTRTNSEKKNAEAQKKSASEAWKHMKAEKVKADDERKLANTEGKKAEEYRLQLDGLRKEIAEVNSKLAFETLKFEEVGKKLEEEKHKVTKERIRADSEMAKADEQMKLAEANGKKLMEEKSRADIFCQQLEDAKQKIEELQKEINNIMSTRNLDSNYQCDQNKTPAWNSELPSLHKKVNLHIEDKRREVKLFEDCVSEGERQINRLKVLLEKEKEKADHIKKNAEVDKRSAAEAWEIVKAEKARADEERKNADIERGKAEGYQIQLETSRKEANETKAKLMSEILQFEKAFIELEREKHQKFEAEEQRKIVEVNKKIALEEKSRADQLSCQLEESRHKIEELQKQIKELLSFRKAVEASTALPGKDRDIEARNLRLLEKQLKLEKMHLKYAKQVAKLEKNRNSILQKELGHIAMDSVQISRRLGALSKRFSSGIEYREDVDKATNMRRSILKRKLCDSEQFPVYAQAEGQLLKSNGMGMAASDHLMKIRSQFFSVSGGNCAASISGIDSKLKSLDGGSSRKLLQSSAMNSSSASFFDDQLVGSQDRGGFISTRSEKQVEENGGQTTSCMSDEATEIQCNENLAVVAESSVRSPHNIDAFGEVDGHARKYDGVLDAIVSAETLYSEGKKLHVQMEEKLSVLHGMLNREIDKPMKESKCLEASVECCLYAKHEGGHKKKKVHCDGRTILQHECHINEQDETAQTRNDVRDDANACKLAISSAINRLGISHECIKGLSDSFGSDLETMERVKEIENGDYMRLLDLDSPVDEECYRRAMEMPLSPTLPEIEISSSELFDIDKFKVVDNCNGGLSNEREVLAPSHSFDVIDVEISSNSLWHDALGTSCNEVMLEEEGIVNSLDTFGNGNGCNNTMEIEGTFNGWTRDSEMVEMSNTPNSSDEGHKSSNISSESKLALAHDNFPAYCVVFSNDDDCRSVSRIFCSIRTCVVHCSLDTERDCTVQKILHALKMEGKLLPREKACVFFTLLLLNFSWCTSFNSGSFVDKEFFVSLDSFASRINAVVSNVEARSFFADLCSWEELVGLIEDFLINGQLMVYTDASSEILDVCNSRINIFLDGTYINLSSKPASANQLVAGSIILTSVCTAIDHVEFICAASYNLLQIRKYDTDVLLIVFHVFAYLGGEKFFSIEEYSLIMTVIRSIIVFLEGANSYVSSASCPIPFPEVRSKFHPYAKCPFGTVSVDMVMSLLLEKLHGYCHSSNFHVLCHKDSAKQSLSHEQIFGVFDVNTGASFYLNNRMMSSTHSNSFAGGNLFDLGDALSLVELVACYMSWEWTCGKVIPVLLEILERPMLVDFAVAVVLLLGQLGRLGVAACGRDNKEVEDLKSKLASFLWNNTTTRASLPLQIATITSLLGLMCFDFEYVVQSDLKLPEIACQSVYIDLIRKWFSGISKEQQSLAYGLLRTTAVVTS